MLRVSGCHQWGFLSYPVLGGDAMQLRRADSEVRGWRKAEMLPFHQIEGGKGPLARCKSAPEI